MRINGLYLKFFTFQKERCLGGEEKRNSSLTMQPLKVVVLFLSAKRDMEQHQHSLFMPSWCLGTKGVFSFEGIESFSLWSLHCQPTNGAVKLPESRKSSPSCSQHWCPHNLQVIKVVVKGFSALAVLLLWAVLPWCAFIFLHIGVQTKAVVQTVDRFLFAACGSSLIFVSALCINCLVPCCTFWPVSGAPPFLPIALFFAQS